MKKQNAFSRIWDMISAPFVSVAVMIDESRRNNEDGSWDKYWERKNRRAKKKMDRKAAKIARKTLEKKSWKITMESGGGTCYCFMGGFDSEEEAVKVASNYDWIFVDENGFAWSLEVVEE